MSSSPTPKIAIIGAGISGLAQYLFLVKHLPFPSPDITIFEARQPLDAHTLQRGEGNIETYNASQIGASIGLSPTGLKVLQRLDGTLYDEVLTTGHVVTSWRMSTARGWVLADISAGGEGERVVMIGRQRLCEIFERVVSERSEGVEGVVVRRKVVDVRLGGEGGRPKVVLGEREGEHEEEKEFDLIIGCDGIWSVARRAMFGGRGREEYEFCAKYEGLVGVGGFVPSDMFCDVPEGQMNIVNGGNGFFGYGYSSCANGDPYKRGDTGTWWSTYSLKDLPEDWSPIDKEAVKKELQRRHLGWKNKTVQNIVASVEVDSLYPQLTTPLLPTWEKGGVVLVGDAAHALTPSSAQGVSMALEDCETLALMLKHHLSNDLSLATALARASRDYCNVRKPRLDMVWRKAREFAAMKQDMSFVEEMIMYLFIWMFSKLKLNEAYHKKLNHYDVPTAVEDSLKGRA